MLRSLDSCKSRLRFLNSNPGLLIGSPPFSASVLAIPIRTNQCVIRPKRALGGLVESFFLLFMGSESLFDSNRRYLSMLQLIIAMLQIDFIDSPAPVF